STYNSNIYKEVDELYIKLMYLKNYKCIIIVLQQQLQEQKNKELLMITKFQ
ncbi:4658_t:CDS:1, partial [Dentiscutata heterogama]